MNTETTKEPKIVKMSVTDRVYALGCIQTLPCTWRLRVEYEQVQKILTPSVEDKQKAGLTMDSNGQPVAENDFYTDVDVTDFPPGIGEAAVRQLNYMQESRLTEHGDILHKLYHKWCKVLGPVFDYVEVEDPKRPDIQY